MLISRSWPLLAWLLAAPVAQAESPPIVSPQTPLATVHAEGAQIYICKPNARGELGWQFREPVAALIRDGITIGYHGLGPSWHFDDGSVLRGKVHSHWAGATSADIDWLELDVIAVTGSGPLTAATTIRRINTHGGKPASGCSQAEVLISIGYSADYVFDRKAPATP